MRFQFQRMTSRGAYRVCAVAMAVKMRPKAPQAAKIRGAGKRRARNHSGAEGIKREHDVSGSSSVEAARNIPEGESEAESGGQEGRADEPAMLVKPELVEQNRILRQMEEDARD